MISRVHAIVAAGIAVVGHVGLLPQSVTSADGYRAQGRDAAQALAIVADADALAAAGCAALVIEAVPAAVAAAIAGRLSIPVIGIGAGAGVHGQVLVYHDLLGLGEGRLARFVRQYLDGRMDQVSAIRRWADDVRARRFPSEAESYAAGADALEALRQLARPAAG
jgi:3-methyl-2-oxobutanoate hydroxymethyltransferase